MFFHNVSNKIQNLPDDYGEQPDIKKGAPQWINTKKSWKVDLEASTYEYEKEFPYLSTHVLKQDKNYGLRIYGQSSMKPTITERIILPDDVPDIVYQRAINKQKVQNIRNTINNEQIPYNPYMNKLHDLSHVEKVRLDNKIRSVENHSIKNIYTTQYLLDSLYSPKK